MRPSPALPKRGLRLVAGVGAGGDGAHLILGVTTLEQPRSHSQDRSARQSNRKGHQRNTWHKRLQGAWAPGRETLRACILAPGMHSAT
jgi:hypothetical protein